MDEEIAEYADNGTDFNVTFDVTLVKQANRWCIIAWWKRCWIRCK